MSSRPARPATSARPHARRSQAACPHVGTTIFTVMSALAPEHGAVNLGQGFPDFDCDPQLLDAVDATRCARGLNQYPPMAGVPALREAHRGQDRGALRPPLRRRQPRSPITAGATQAIITAILAVVHPGDEVIVLDPCYDSYVPEHRAGRRHRRCTCR